MGAKTCPPELRRRHTQPAQRREAIWSALETSGAVAIPEMASRFHVSEMTIRRDLDGLEAAGRVRRTHGGAVVAARMAFEFDFAARRRSNRKAKLAIAAAAAALVQPGTRLILDAGTTTLELARVLRDRRDLTVVTPSLAVASELQFSDSIQVVLL
ncbi:MAG: DeoR/GlpR family DNA-binding transcription regulator, partial [Kiritimatiellae bacterium]|nr:DeoR/GlpR family DNA-binding transcription regulator [Kiritimatiellia bacterium]